MCLDGDIQQSFMIIQIGTQAIAQGLRLVDRNLAATRERRNGVCNGVVETPIQDSKLVRENGVLFFYGYRSDGLADLSIFVDDLVDTIPEAQQLRAMQRGGATNRGGRWRFL